ncbi:MAG: RidA family protein [Bacteroidota bacterium]|nr:RidA family protein [Bacteroidota bacterium]
MIVPAPRGVKGQEHNRAIHTPNAPAAIGPYSQAVISGNTVFVSGQLGVDPHTGMFVEGGVREQTARAIDNIAAVLEAAGTNLEHVVSCTVFLADMNDFPAMNEVYGNRFREPYPARATIQAARLPKNALVEISCIAVLP